ncbi:PAS domain-containing sensor histidine kinase [Halioxenophilus aromaticivorans]|uniref:histidine kinase n=1 Tax=Halioxenophilus aromaticivorans TaxID=1306992 RepID=A0AAV3U236_9ALTE
MQTNTITDGFEAVFRNSKDGLAIFKDGMFVDCNQSMLELVGVSTPEAFVGHTPIDFSPEYQPDGQKSVDKSLALIELCYQKGSLRFEWLHTKSNGDEFWVEVILTRMVLNGEIVLHTNWRDISEKKRLELETAAQKETFETLFNESVDGLCLLNEKSYLDCNQAFLWLPGFSKKEDTIGLTPIDISPEFQSDGRTSVDAAAAIIQHAFTQGSIRFEWIHKKADDTEFWCEIIVTKTNLNGEDVLYAITRDISEKKRLELETAAQKETFETLFNESVDGLCLLNEKSYLDCNQAFLTLLGFSKKEDIIGLTPIDISPEFQSDGRASVDAAAAIIQHAFTQGSIRFEWIHKKADGTEFWCEIIVTKTNLNGEDVLYAITRDISEKKRLELETAAQKENFETLFNESVDGLCLLNEKSYLDCNQAFLSLLGFSKKEDIIGLTPIDISPEFQSDGRASVDAATAIIQHAFTQGSIRFEWIHKKADGTEFWCEIIVTKTNINGEDVLYAITRDISEKKKLEIAINDRNADLKTANDSLEEMLEDLRRTQDKLVESEKMASLGSLVAGVAHEINTPIGIGLTGVTQLMEESRDIRQSYQAGKMTQDDFEEFLDSTNEISDIVKKNLDRTAHLVRSFKQVAVDQTCEEDRQINIKTYIDEVVFSLASVLRKDKVDVAIDCDAHHEVMTNPGLLSQVLTNLIVNSVNHGFSYSNGGAISIGVSKTADDEIQIDYKDNGRGISQENLPKIFDPFFTTRRNRGGTGLGLNIIYNIITGPLGGSIECHSKENEGVQFLVKFKVQSL